MRNIKFLGGGGDLSAEHLDNAVRTVSVAVVRASGAPATDPPSEDEKNTLRDLLGYLGLVAADDPQEAHGGRTVGSLQHPTDY